MKIHNKLVRDKIPEIITTSGKSCTVKYLTKAEYLDSLYAKLYEELMEYQESKNPEELVDLLEVIYELSTVSGLPPGDLDKLRNKKAEERGRFNKKIMLLSVDD
jgi:predicted house-cleaning noncanonical NTP pyrophosphatase (MazG superfamily)